MGSQSAVCNDGNYFKMISLFVQDLWNVNNSENRLKKIKNSTSYPLLLISKSAICVCLCVSSSVWWSGVISALFSLVVFIRHGSECLWDTVSRLFSHSGGDVSLESEWNMLFIRLPQKWLFLSSDIIKLAVLSFSVKIGWWMK